jgi:anti-sigma regulatory factor (Ser/Thr protein kinase)
MSNPLDSHPNSRPDLCLELVSNPIYLCGVREMVAQSAKRLGFADPQCSQIALAVDEALTNIMKHGYERRLDGRIWLKLLPTQTSSGPVLEVVIEDEAKQVDPCIIKGRDLEDVRPGGLGVHIIKEVMDEVRYEKRGGDTGGMRLTMIKRQSSSTGPGTTTSNAKGG